MRFRLVAMLAAILAVTAAYPAGAGKVTIDPNKTKPATAAAPQKKPDPQLAQKVTYTATDKRLHSVLEDISKQTGVIVYSGKTPADWPVRDLPVIVCVRDLPLGKLLRYIADSTHLALTSTTVKNVRRYRIWRDPRREKQLADYYQKDREVRLAHANWEWDGLVKFGQKYAGKPLTDPTLMETRDLGKVFASLSPEARESVFAGKQIRLTTRDTKPPMSDYLRALYLDWWQGYRMHVGDLNENEIACMSLDIKLPERYSTCLGCPHLQAPLGYRGAPITVGSYDVLLEEEGMYASEPKYPEGPRTDYSPSLVNLDLEKTDSPILNQKIRIAKPKVGEEITYPDVVSRVSEASKFSIVLENLQGHQWHPRDVANLPIYDRDTTLQALLRALKRSYYRSNTDWFVDNDSHLLVGSASGFPVREGPTGEEWWNLHRALAPEVLISNLVKKYNGDGLEIDDMAAAMLLNNDQRREWIFLNKDLLEWQPVPHTEPFWRLYAGLSAENKAVAKSSAGLPLGKLSPDVVQAAFTESSDLAEAEGLEKRGDDIPPPDDPDLQKRLDDWLKQHYPELGRVMLGVDPLPVDIIQVMNEIMADFPEVKAMWDIPTDMDVISRLNMRLIIKEHDTQPVFDEHDNMVMKPVPEELRTHSYTLAIQGDGVNLRIRAPLYAFPAYSEKRKKQLEEAQKKNGEQNP